jgi:uncharacterized membrane protein YbhN (UPF0104 family)
MKVLKKAIEIIVILILIGLALYYFPNLMRNIFTLFVPLMGLLTVLIFIAAILFQRHRSRDRKN